MKCLILIILFLFIGCVSRVREVPVDRPVYCADLPPKPVFSVTQMKKEQPLKQKVALILIERQERIAYEAELEAIIIGCSSK